MKKFNQFCVDFLLENLNESRLYMSPKFIKIVKSTNTDIGKELVKSHGEDFKPDMTFIDIDIEKEGNVTFNTMSNVMKKNKGKKDFEDFDKVKNISLSNVLWEIEVDKKNVHPPDRYGTYFSKSRNSIKLGRLINRLFPKKFKDKDVEDFVNKFKSNVENSLEKFELVSGDDIAKWYAGENYLKNSGSLGSSCMKNCDYFDIYTQNSQCRMLVLFEEGKVKGRALIWKIHNPQKDFEYFMDRQYTITDADVHKFRSYADKEGWAYKTHNNHSSTLTVTYEGEDFTYHNMMVKLDEVEFDTYPYMDTFKALNKGENIIRNDSSHDDNSTYFLEETDGGYDEGGVWSDWESQRIPEDEAVYSEYMSDYIYSEDAAIIQLGSNRYRDTYIHTSHDEYVYDEVRDKGMLMDDSIYSDHYMSYIYIEDAKEGIIDFDLNEHGRITDVDTGIISTQDNDVTDGLGGNAFEWLKEQFSNIEDDYILKEFVVKETDWGWWIPKYMAVEVYPTGIEAPKRLSKIDSYLLGIEIDTKKEKETISIVDYNMELNDDKGDTKHGYLTELLSAIERWDSQKRMVFDEEEDKLLYKEIRKREDNIGCYLD